MMPVIIDTRVPRHTGLNRTFYGIETTNFLVWLILLMSLNRTFYGIETLFKSKDFKTQVVLIVPFMELKLVYYVYSD